MIKTLKDRPNLLRARGTTIARLARLPRPKPFPPPKVCKKARVTGVAFFDYQYRVRGEAQNAIELHPVLGFDCLDRS